MINDGPGFDAISTFIMRPHRTMAAGQVYLQQKSHTLHAPRQHAAGEARRREAHALMQCVITPGAC